MLPGTPALLSPTGLPGRAAPPALSPLGRAGRALPPAPSPPGLPSRAAWRPARQLLHQHSRPVTVQVTVTLTGERYRHLVKLASQAIVNVAADDLHIGEANHPAERLAEIGDVDARQETHPPTLHRRPRAAQ